MNSTVPQRIQRKRTPGWRMPEGAKYVGRPSVWGNPYRVGVTQVRMPALDGSEWEHEGRLHKVSGERHSFVHSDGRVSWHQVELATAEQCVILFEEHIGVRPLKHSERRRPLGPENFRRLVRSVLRGRTLACWCALDVPCHADVLLKVANEGDEGDDLQS